MGMLLATAAFADRAGKLESSIQIIESNSGDSDGINGSSIDFDSDTGWGVGFAYNLDSRFALGLDLTFLDPKYTAVFNPETSGALAFTHEADVLITRIYGTYHLTEGPLVPFVQAGFGWTILDSNVSDGRPTTGCWWDPWWGYTCATNYSSYSDTRFSWDLAVGLRYEFGYDLFVKGSWDYVNINEGPNSADPTVDMWRLEFGRVF